MGLQPVSVRGGEVFLWRGLYQLELAKDEQTDGDAHVHWAIGGVLPPERPASAWQLLNDAPPFKSAKQATKGGWTIQCPCECEVCKQNARYRTRKLRDFRTIVLSVCTMSSVRSLLPVCELRATFTQFLNIVILFALPQSVFLYRRRGHFGSLTPMRCAKRSRNLALLWGPWRHAPPWYGRLRPFFSARGRSLEQRSGYLCRPGCPATLPNCSRGSAQCPDGCHRVPG